MMEFSKSPLTIQISRPFWKKIEKGVDLTGIRTPDLLYVSLVSYL